ncbi:Uncharacterised protein [Mycobacteroides abscessus subsp. abscessus]|nr:Uncharacterised protein [Mycobacteroides abscessus subsp. abscessus]
MIQPEGLSGFELQSLLEDEGIYPEMADPYNVVFVLPLLKKDMDFPFKEIIFKTEKAMSGKRKGQTAKVNYFQKPSVCGRKDMRRADHSVSSRYSAPFSR